jgi:CRP/FNR family cyclic AMP-dependent transcriptional regulator
VVTVASPSTGFLGQLTAAEREALTALGHRRRYRRGATLFTEGDRSTHVVLILSGQVRVSYMTEGGREIVFATKEAGDLLGELSAIDDQPRSATASTTGPTEVLVVEGADFMDFVRTHPGPAVLLLRMVSQRLREADRRQVEFGCLDTVERVTRRLLELASTGADAPADGEEVLVSISQHELAAWIGASREAVNKALATLRAPGWIATRRGGVVLLDRAALERRCR